jgi:metallo-beta-lactamase family protein
MTNPAEISVTLLGAAGDVTGSAYAVSTSQSRVLVDFGMFQGGKRADLLNTVPRELKPKRLDAVLLTHAHLDHTGRLPLLARAGYTGPIYATPATIELTGLILRDSAKVQAQDAERHNRKRLRAGQDPVPPLYGIGEVEAVLAQLRPVPYREPVPVARGVQARFVEAGHMLGSSSIELLVASADSQRSVVFSGDLGPAGAPILKDFEPFRRADMVFLESTYGDRNHRAFGDTVNEFVDILKAAVARKGKVLIPTFAVGRAQVLTTLLAYIFRQRLLDPFPVYLDSPMAIEASKIYAHHPELYDEEMLAMIREHPIADDLRTLQATATPDESRRINDCTGPCLVMAGAGMCNAGRILHHFRNNLWRPETSVVIVGFQSEGTLGRQLVDGKKMVKVFGEPVRVHARVHTLGGFSAHAGQDDLLRWFKAMAESRPRTILTHGEAKAREALAGSIRERHAIDCVRPKLGDVVEV